MLVGCTNLEGNNEDKPNNTLVSEAGSSSISAENPDIEYPNPNDSDIQLPNKIDDPIEKNLDSDDTNCVPEITKPDIIVRDPIDPSILITNSMDHTSKDEVNTNTIEIKYYGYKHNYIKLYKMLPDIKFESYEGNVNISYAISDAITEKDVIDCMRLLLIGYLQIESDKIELSTSDDGLVNAKVAVDIFEGKKSDYISGIHSYLNEYELPD